MKSKILDSIIMTIQDKGVVGETKGQLEYVAVLVLFREKWIISLRNLQKKKRNLKRFLINFIPSKSLRKKLRGK